MFSSITDCVRHLFKQRKADPQTDHPPDDDPELGSAAAGTAFARGAVKLWLDKFVHIGRQEALDSGEISLSQQRAAAAERVTATQGKVWYRGPFDPNANDADAALQKRRDDAQERERQCRDEVFKTQSAYEAALTEVPAQTRRPRASALIIGAGILTGTLAFGCAIFELGPIQSIDDGVLRAVAAFGLGCTFSGLATLAMYGLHPHGKRDAVSAPDSENHGWHATGIILISGGFFLVRVAAATTEAEKLLALGLSSVEVGALFLVKADATRFRQRYRIWAEDQATRAAKLQLAQIAEDRLDDAESALEDAKKLTQEVEAQYDERLARGEDIKTLSDAALWAWKSGFQQGMDVNKRRYEEGKKGRMAA
jgi:hypothetical protein